MCFSFYIQFVYSYELLAYHYRLPFDNSNDRNKKCDDNNLTTTITTNSEIVDATFMKIISKMENYFKFDLKVNEI